MPNASRHADIKLGTALGTKAGRTAEIGIDMVANEAYR